MRYSLHSTTKLLIPYVLRTDISKIITIHYFVAFLITIGCVNPNR